MNLKSILTFAKHTKAAEDCRTPNASRMHIYQYVPNCLKSLCLCVFVFNFSDLQAQTNNSSTHEAEVYFDAGNYTQARHLYAKQLEQSVSSWQIAIIQYNLGTLSLLENNWGDAIEHFLLADTLQDDLPLLQQRVAVNMAWAQLMLITQENEATSKDFTTLFEQLKELFDDIHIAEQANCHLQRAEGNKDFAADCLDVNIESIQTKAKDLLQQIQASYSEYQRQHSSEEQSVSHSLNALLVQYYLTLIERQIQEPSLTRLSEMQEALNARVDSLNTAEAKTAFQQAQRYLHAGIISLKHSPIQMRMFVEMACNSVSDVLQVINTSEANKLESLLTQAINKQRLALQLNRLRNATAQKLSENADALENIIQEQVNQIAAKFLTMSVTEQKKNPTSRPWDELIAAFAQGQKFALEAQNLIKISPHNFLTIKSLQNKTLNAWRETADLLHTKPSPSATTETESHPNEAPSPQRLKDQELNTILRNLQDMEADDRSKPELKSSSPQQNEERPW